MSVVTVFIVIRGPICIIANGQLIHGKPCQGFYLAPHVGVLDLRDLVPGGFTDEAGCADQRKLYKVVVVVVPTLQTGHDWGAWVRVCCSRRYLMRTAIRGLSLGPGIRAIHLFFASWHENP